MVPNIGPIDRAPLVILAITDRYPPSELEVSRRTPTQAKLCQTDVQEEIFSAAQNPRAFRFLHCSLSIERSITTCTFRFEHEPHCSAARIDKSSRRNPAASTLLWPRVTPFLGV